MTTGTTAARIQEATVAAMKARDRSRLGVLRMLQAAIKQVEVDQRRQLDDTGVLKVLSSYARKVKEQIKSFREGGRDDLLAGAEAELAVVAEFLPAELDEAELAEIVRQAITESGASGPRDMGRVMKVVMPLVTGRADGSRVSAMVKRLLPN